MDKTQSQHQPVIFQGLIGLVAILLWIGMIAWLVTFPLLRTILVSEFYAKIFEQNQLYEELPDLVAEAAINEADQSLAPGLARNLFSTFSQEQLETVILDVIPEGWIESQTQSGIDSFLGFVNLKQEDFKITIDLLPVKENLVGPVGKQCLLNLLATLPSCSLDQLMIFMMAFENQQLESLPICNPPVQDLELLDPILTPVLSGFAAVLPSVINLPTSEMSEQISSFQESVVFKGYRSLRKAIPVLPWIIAALALLIISLSFKSIKFMLSAIGFPLIFSGLVTGGWGAVLFFRANKFLSVFVSHSVLNTLPAFQENLQGILESMVLSVGKLTLYISAAAIVAGLVLVLIARVSKR